MYSTKGKDVWVSGAYTRSRTLYTSFYVAACMCLYCTVKRGPTFPRTRTVPLLQPLPTIRPPFSPVNSFRLPNQLHALSFPPYSPTSDPTSELPLLLSTVELRRLPLPCIYLSFSLSLFLYRQPSSVPFLPSGLNCCNLWPILVDLTVELSHGDLYGLLILHRCRGWNLAMGFHRFSTTTGWLYARERIGISSGRDARFHHVNQFSDRAIADSFRRMFFYPAASVKATEYL